MCRFWDICLQNQKIETVTAVNSLNKLFVVDLYQINVKPFPVLPYGLFPTAFSKLFINKTSNDDDRLVFHKAMCESIFKKSYLW